MEELLRDIKLLLRITDEEEDLLIEKLIESALEWVETECNLEEIVIEEIPRGLKSVIVDMVIFRYGVIGKEGINSENIVELSYSYNNDYPDYILRRLKKFRKIRIK